MGIKCWYIIPESQLDELNSLTNEINTTNNIDRKNFLLHKSLMIPPSVLKANGVHHINF